jgi:hypothetical protein
MASATGEPWERQLPEHQALEARCSVRSTSASLRAEEEAVGLHEALVGISIFRGLFHQAPGSLDDQSVVPGQDHETAGHVVLEHDKRPLHGVLDRTRCKQPWQRPSSLVKDDEFHGKEDAHSTQRDQPPP